MGKIRELTLAELEGISGGGNYADVHDAMGIGTGGRGAGNSLGRNAPTHIYSNPDTVNCANNVFGGLIGGIPKGPAGMAVGVVSGAIKGDCLGSSGNNSGNNGGCNSGTSNCSGSDASSTCNR